MYNAQTVPVLRAQHGTSMQYIGTYRHSKATIHTIDATVGTDERTADIILEHMYRRKAGATARENTQRRLTSEEAQGE